MKTLCYSVRLESLVRISDKAFRASAFDGSTAVIPASQIFGVDADELLRFKQISGLAELFRNRDFSESTEP